MADGQVIFEITADGKQAIASIKDVTKAIESETKKWDNAAGDSADDAESAWTGAVGKIASALSAAGVVAALAKWGKSAISAASDLAEVQNVVDVTFGEGSAKIDSWSKAAGKSFGLTEKQAKQFTSTIGAMAKSSGLAGNEIVDMSTDLAGLAADMASFYNLDFETAFQKIRSGISGETEPLKQLGVNMSAANLEAFRLEQGITKSYNAMSQAEQVALRYKYIMKATADAQGDFARTSDGFANASRQVETAMETIKTKGGELLLEVVGPLTAGLAKFLEQITAVGETTVLDDFSAIDKKTGEKVGAYEQTASEANDLIEQLELLSDKTSLTDEEQRRWLETCKQLVKTIPGLNAIINTETGEITGGTSAVRTYVDEWEKGQKKLAYLKSHEAKKTALDNAFADLPELDLARNIAASKVKAYFDDVQDIYKKYSLGLNFDSEGMLDRSVFSVATPEEQARLKEFANIMDSGLGKEYALREKTYLKRKEEYELARKLYLEEEDFINSLPGAVDKADTATKYWSQDLQEAGKAALEASKQALSALNDYVQGVRDSTAQAVDSIVKGFESITRPNEEAKKKISNLVEELSKVKVGSKEYEKIQQQIKELNRSMQDFSTKGMQEGLKSQLAFMDEYLKNLEKAQKLGLSGELLASLSDGSVQSAEYLAELVANPEQAKQVDALYQQVQQKKAEFTEALTDQKLTVDQTYQAMVDAAKQAIESMDLGEEAKNSMGNTIGGLASGIMAHVPDVTDAVNAVIAELRRLQGFGIDIKLGSFGDIPLLDGEHERGLDYVPFDGYLAGLHEGEGILTAEENRVWQRFKNGQSPQTMDYDALGATMRDNVKAGGNVYLDGRSVGRVISDQQGADYRALKRSGFQA